MRPTAVQHHPSYRWMLRNSAQFSARSPATAATSGPERQNKQQEKYNGRCTRFPRQRQQGDSHLVLSGGSRDAFVDVLGRDRNSSKMWWTSATATSNRLLPHTRIQPRDKKKSELKPKPDLTRNGRAERDAQIRDANEFRNISYP